MVSKWVLVPALTIVAILGLCSNEADSAVEHRTSRKAPMINTSYSTLDGVFLDVDQENVAPNGLIAHIDEPESIDGIIVEERNFVEVDENKRIVYASSLREADDGSFIFYSGSVVGQNFILDDLVIGGNAFEHMHRSKKELQRVRKVFQKEMDERVPTLRSYVNELIKGKEVMGRPKYERPLEAKAMKILDGVSNQNDDQEIDSKYTQIYHNAFLIDTHEPIVFSGESYDSASYFVRSSDNSPEIKEISCIYTNHSGDGIIKTLKFRGIVKGNNFEVKEAYEERRNVIDNMLISFPEDITYDKIKMRVISATIEAKIPYFKNQMIFNQAREREMPYYPLTHDPIMGLRKDII